MNPPYQITDKMIKYIADIAKLTGSVKGITPFDKNPVLRRKNRIQTVYGSLSMEQNALTMEQVTAVLDGKMVIAPPKDIEEVKNAFEIYEVLDSLNPYSVDDLLKVHGVMMQGLLPDAGEFRQGSVGVVDSQTGEIIHFGTLAKYVPEAIYKLMDWAKNSDVHPLIQSCVFHYEFELIHPFSDGNGRCGRLWHTLILSKWNPLFAWIPVESMIHRNQEEYYRVINKCNEVCASTMFVEFMLDIIKSALAEAIDAGYSEDQKPV